MRKVGDLTVSPIIVRATLLVMDQEKALFYFMVLNVTELQPHFSGVKPSALMHIMMLGEVKSAYI